MYIQRTVAPLLLQHYGLHMGVPPTTCFSCFKQTVFDMMPRYAATDAYALLRLWCHLRLTIMSNATLALNESVAADAYLTAAGKPHAFKLPADLDCPEMELGWLAAVAAGQESGQVLQLLYWLKGEGLLDQERRLLKLRCAAEFMSIQLAEEREDGVREWCTGHGCVFQDQGSWRPWSPREAAREAAWAQQQVQ
jgi:hypothetical protein